MRNLKWWQWCLIIFIGLPAIGATFDVITGRETKRPTDEQGYEPADAKFKPLSGDAVFAMTFNPKVDPSTLPDIAREHCGSRDFCKVLAWTDPKFAAKGFPMTNRETAQVKFQYTVNRQSGFEQTLWDCRVWKQFQSKTCL